MDELGDGSLDFRHARPARPARDEMFPGGALFFRPQFAIHQQNNVASRQMRIART